MSFSSSSLILGSIQIHHDSMSSDFVSDSSSQASSIQRRRTYYHIPVDQDSRSAIDSTAFSSSSALTIYHVQLCPLERYIVLLHNRHDIDYSFVEISVNFMKKRPKSDLKLVFKDDTGVKHESNKFKKGDLVIWNLDMCVHLRCNYSDRPIKFVQVC